jgi:hypothetical protein
MWGAGASGGNNGSPRGGAGAMVQGILQVTSGETLKVIVGQGGYVGPSAYLGMEYLRRWW